MPLTLDGTNGVSAVQAGAVESGDLPAGSVLQVVQGVDTSAFIDTTSTSFIATNTTASITPSSTSSKILVIYTANIDEDGGRPVTTVFRNGLTNLAPNNTETNAFTHTDNVGGDRFLVNQSAVFLDSPSSVSEVNYTVEVKRAGGVPELIRYRTDLVPATITLMEIAG